MRGRVTEMSLGGPGRGGQAAWRREMGPLGGATGGHPSSTEFTAAMNSRDYCNSLGGDRQEAGRRDDGGEARAGTVRWVREWGGVRRTPRSALETT